MSESKPRNVTILFFILLVIAHFMTFGVVQTFDITIIEGEGVFILLFFLLFFLAIYYKVLIEKKRF